MSAQPGPRVAQAVQLVDDIRAALAAARLDKAHATCNAAEIPSGARNGVVIVSPPSLEFPTWDETTATWELHVIAGPATDYLAAWEVLDQIIQALVDGNLNLKKAEPTSYQPQQGNPLPAYTLTLNPLD